MMRKPAIVGALLVSVLAAATVRAAEEGLAFHALGSLSTGERAALSALADDQLASVEGGLLSRGDVVVGIRGNSVVVNVE